MADEELKALAAEVRYLRDRLDIQDAIIRYCRGIDRLDSPLLQSAYHPDAVDDRGPFTGSPAEFVDWVFPHVSGAKGTMHNISNISVEIDGDQAHSESYITFAVWTADGAKVIQGGGRYLDRLQRRDGRWGIVHRETFVDYVFEVPANPQQGGGMPTSVRDKSDRSYVRPLDLTAEARARLAAKAR